MNFTYEGIRDLAAAFQKSRVLLTAYELGVFSALGYKARTLPAFGALFALNMLVATESGDTYTEAEVRQWMQRAGLCAIKRKDTAFGTTLIIGRK